jgi:cysteine-rich repeat protein
MTRTLVPRGTVALALLLALGGGCGIGPAARVVEICDNRIDDDADGKTDCEDLDCKDHPPACMPEICDNSRDEDGDGQFDCADSDCFADPMCEHSQCGNDVIDTGEECDGAELGGKTCVSQGFVSGALACRTCRLDVSGCTAQAVESCSNGSDDDADGKVDCDDSQCFNHPHCRCGNGMIDQGENGFEDCDGAELASQTCDGLGFAGGTLACTPACKYDTSMCTPPVCGDGVITGEEQCDDHNTTPGDGCDATCHVEVDLECQAATPLALGANHGDTSTGSDFFTGSCGDFSGREQVFSFTPAQAGTLVLVLTSSTDLGLYVRTTCATDTSEIACASTSPAGASESLSFAVQAGVPLTVLVDGGEDIFPPFPSEDANDGPFTLSLFQTP